jgi:hypothetical protein
MMNVASQTASKPTSRSLPRITTSFVNAKRVAARPQNTALHDRCREEPMVERIEST